MKIATLKSLMLSAVLMCVSIVASATTVEEFFSVTGDGSVSVTNDATYPWTVNDNGELVSNMHVDNGNTTISFTNNSATEVQCSFKWKKFGESNCDYIYYSIDGSKKAANQSNGDYVSVTLILKAGQRLSFTYRKDGSGTVEPDCGYIKDLVFAAPRSYTDANNSNWCFYEKKDGTWSIDSYSGSDTNLNIPATINYNGTEYTVNEIADSVFKNNTNITSVTIPVSVKTIGVYAFGGCTNLSAVTVSADISLGTNAFKNTAVANITYSNGQSVRYVTAGTLSSILTDDEKENLTELTLCGEINGDDIAVIRNMAGRDMSSNVTAGKLATLNLANVNIVGGGTYKDGSTATKNYISGSMFQGCNSLQTFIAPKSLTRISGSAFYQCTALKTVTLSEGITYIGEDAFRECPNLESINIPSTVTTIGDYSTFYNDSKLKTVDIPENSQLSSLGNNTFRGCTSLTSIRIPKGITTIQNQTFYDCSSLETVTFTEGSALKAINYNAFAYCYKLNNIVVPESVTSIGNNAFCSCTALANLTIPAGCQMTSIGSSAFANSGITSVDIPATVVTINESAFSNCSKLTTLNIPESSKLVTIGNNAFYNTKISSLYIPKNVADISNTGYSNSNLKTITVNPTNSVYSSVDGVLYNKGKTTLITVPQGFRGGFTIPATVTAIADNAFNGCTGIKAMYSLAATPPTCTESSLAFNKHTVPMFVPRGSLEAYKATAWAGVENLMEYTEQPSIWFADKLITLYNTKFDETKNASIMAVAITPEGPSNATISWTSDDTNVVTVDNTGKVTVAGTGTTSVKATATINDVAVEASCPVTVVGYGENQTVLYVTAGNLSTLISAEDKDNITDLTLFGTINSDDVRFIREMAGRDVENKVTSGSLSKLDLSKTNIVSGGSYYFNLTNYGSYSTSNNVIGGRMFYQCNNLTDVILPQTAISLDNCAFYGCKSLQNVTLPDGLLYIYSDAFRETSNLKTIDIPSTVKSIDSYAFYNSTKLAEVSIPVNSDLTSIGENAFRDCNVLKSISLPASLTTINKYAFYSCDSLTSVTFGENSKLKSIGYAAFQEDYKLKEISIPTSVTEVGQQAFYNCYNLQTLTIPETSALVSIGTNAFYNTKISQIYLPATLTTIGESAFNSCTQLTAVTIANDSKMTNIYNNAFYNCSSLTSFTLPSRVASIGDRAFSGCSSLMTFSIPEDSKLATVGTNAFYGCSINNFYIPQLLTDVENISYNNSKLKTITVNAKNNTYKSVDGVLYSKNDNTLLAVPHGLVGQYKSPDFLTTIPANAFNGCVSLRSVVLSDKITSVEANAFSGCSGLKVIHSLNPAPPTSLAESFNTLATKTLPVFVPIGSLAAYKTTNWGSFALLQEYSTTPSMWISESNINLYDTKFDETRYKELSAVVLTPQGPSDAQITWSTGDATVATVDNGNVAIAGPNGNTTITASATVGTTPVSAQCAVKTIGFTADQNVYYVHAGGLSSLIPSAEKYTMTNLTLFGELNSSDIRYIREMCKSSIYYQSTTNNGSLHSLDMSNVNIVSGGNGYVYANQYFYTRNNSFDGYEFSYCKTLREVKLPQTVTSLGDCAFDGCDNLESVVMPENITVLGASTFYDCKKLNTITCDGTKIKIIGNYAFNNCSALTSVDIPNATSVGNYAFNNCSALTSVDIPNATTVGSYAFNNCSALTSANMPNVTKVYEYAFSNTILQSVTVYNIASIGNNAFNSNSLEELHITATDVPALTGGNLINTSRCVVVVPAASLNAYRTANGWSNFYQQIVPDDANLNITAEVKAETGTSGLQTKVGATPLSYATHLTLSGSINSYDLMMMRNKMPNLHYLDLTNTTVEANPYEYITGCHTEANRIGNKAFYQFTKLLEVKLPNSITYVGQYAFDGCSNLRSVTMYDGITTIDSYAFQSCSSLKSVEIPATVAGINYGAFRNCSNLQEVTMHEGLLTIGNYVFNGCNSLKTLTFPSTTTNIGSYAFYNCNNLETIALPAKLTSISSYTFQGCSALKSIAIPSRVNTIGSKAFYGCSKLEEMRIPPMLETIGDQAFSGCSALKDIYVYIANAKDISINQNTFGCWTTAMLHVPDFASNSYYWDTQWSQFVNITEFNEDYETFYTKNTMTLDTETGTIGGNPDAEIHENGGLVVDDVDQNLGDVDLADNGTDGASLIPQGNGKITAKNVKVTIKVTGYKWHFFCFPFDIPMDSIKYDGEYVWRQYDGARRSRREGGWQNLAEGTTKLEKGRGYIFQGTKTGNLVMTVANPDISGTDYSKSLDTNAAESAQDAGWNFVGNPYTSYYNVTEETYSSPITIWTGSTYEAYRPGDDDYTFAPYQAFFVQTTEDGKKVEFDKDNRESYTESKQTAAKAKARRAKAKTNPSRLLINLELTADGDTTYTDKTRIVFNNTKSLSYEPDCDAAKFESSSAKAQLFTLNSDGVKYAINERPVAQGIVPMGIKVANAGAYSIAATRQDGNVLLIDYQEGVTHDLSLGAYQFTAAQGDFSNRFAIKLGMETTSIETLVAKTGVNISTDGGINISGVADDTDISVYNLSGACVKTQKGNGSITVAPGTYILSVGILRTKLAVK